MAKHLISPIVHMGSKRRLMEQLMEEIPKGLNRFVDVFGGSGSVALNVDANEIWLNEKDKTLYKLHKYYTTTDLHTIQANFSDIVEEYGEGGRVLEEGYYKMRDDYNETKEFKLLPVLLYYAFLNLIRHNQEGEFNTSFNNKRVYPDDNYFKKIYGYADRLNNVDFKLMNKDFRDIDYGKLEEGDFVYFDPPYILTEAVYNRYWTIEDEKDLLNVIKELDKKGVYFGLSNVITHRGEVNQELKQFAKDYEIIDFNIVYSMNVSGNNTETGADEVYITNYKHKETSMW